MTRLLAAGVVIVLLALPALGQPASGRHGPGRGYPTPLPDERANRIIEALLIWRLVDELSLSDQQIARIFPGIKALKEIRLDLGRRKVQLHRELRALLQQQPRDEEAIRVKLGELDTLRTEIEQRRRGVLRRIHAALTVEQQARFALIQERFEIETLRLLDEVRRIVEQGVQQRQ